jgi:hypothetical protein
MKLKAMKVETMDSIAPGNPFLSDAENMGTTIGTNCTVMYRNFPDKECHYLIVIDTTTGQRIKITF